VSGLYVHIPFCKSKCLYCDFNSYQGLDALHDSYVSALIKEIELAARKRDLPAVTSVYFGGGTPTSLNAKLLRKILSVCLSVFSVSPDIEVSIEANPDTIDLAKLIELRKSGFNRLSIGAQSFNKTFLGVLGRPHKLDEILDGYFNARKAGFDNINLDLIFGIPGESRDDWAKTLQQAVTLNPEHISAYCLTLSEKKSLLKEAEEDVQADMYLYARSYLESQNFKHYEISNFARNDRRCRHNLLYWKNRAYLGFGAGAHSHLDQTRFYNCSFPADYIRKIERTGNACVEAKDVSSEDMVAESAFLGLRLNEGINLCDFKQRCGVSFENYYASQVESLKARGLLEANGDYLRLTERGLLLANQVFMEFV
jgi:oxygen-independent coproporphyrinogen-3 oxidase